MKKPLAMILLVLGGAAATVVVALVTGVIFIILASLIPESGGWALYTVAAMFLFLIAYAFGFLREHYRKTHNVNAAVFTVCFCAPALIAAGVVNLIYTPELIGDLGVFSTEALLRFWLIITAVFTLWMIVHAGIAAYKRHMDKNA